MPKTEIEIAVAAERERCLKILRDALDETLEAAADVGEESDAPEALIWVINEITRPSSPSCPSSAETSPPADPPPMPQPPPSPSLA